MDTDSVSRCWLIKTQDTYDRGRHVKALKLLFNAELISSLKFKTGRHDQLYINISYDFPSDFFLIH